MAFRWFAVLMLCLWCVAATDVDEFPAETYQTRKLLNSLVGLYDCEDGMCGDVSHQDDPGEVSYEVEHSPVTEEFQDHSESEQSEESSYVTLTTIDPSTEYYEVELDGRSEVSSVVEETHEDYTRAPTKYTLPDEVEEEKENIDIRATFGKCIETCSSIIKLVHTMRQSEEGFLEYKFETLERMFTIYSEYSDLRNAPSDSCHPAVRVMDSIIVAAQKVKEIYANDTDCSKYEHLYTRGTESVTEANADSTVGLLQSVTRRMGTFVKEEARDEHAAKAPCPGEEQVTEAPCSQEQVTEAPEDPCPHTEEQATEVPCSDEAYEEIIAEEEEHRLEPPFVGSLRGIPGVHYPNYSEVPITSFSCADKKYIPGFYADLETGCQVFHVCYKHRRESFLCPVGTIFNQPILACDYWYSSNCSLSPIYYDVNEKSGVCDTDDKPATGEVPVEVITLPPEELPEVDLDELEKLLPVKAKVVEFPEKPVSKLVPVQPAVDVEEVASAIFGKIVSTATGVVSAARDVVDKLPEPQVEFKPIVVKAKVPGIVPLKMKPIVKTALKAKLPLAVKSKVVATAVKALPVKVAAKAVPVAAKVKLAAALPVKIAAKTVPVVAKAKVAALPVAKVAAIAPKAAWKASIPFKKAVVASKVVPVKAKFTASAALPIKAKLVKSVPLLKVKAATSFLKPKVAAAGIPLAKAALVKTAAISPLTKKALAIGYLKLLKAKKLALLG